ncbi:DUF4355 domain-containing protein [Staphylococcus epidermidis]|uniref:capsid assembly scaffolding protein Gp46 family protein n=1 Tax=Staphylococcus epidermidis TaxID=1282 RepID=UPI001F27AFFF|nr:DUF4355 domain-containing protein [Staphylococcus epidermidis]MCF7581267.1 DUF4355 domain-containing protein [Staphylococcus epidermidis]
MKDELYKLNLQFFAEDNGDDPEKQKEEQQQDNDNENQDNEKTFSQSELDSQVSKAVDKALANRERKHQEEIEKIKENARKEGESYAKLTEKEKQEKALSEREKRIEERERELKLNQLTSDVERDLKEKGLPTSFAESLVVLEDNEKINEAVNQIKKDFDEAVKEQVKEATRQALPESKGTIFQRNEQKQNSLRDEAMKRRIIKD